MKLITLELMNINRGYAGMVRLVGWERKKTPLWVVGMEFGKRIMEVRFSLS